MTIASCSRTRRSTPSSSPPPITSIRPQAVHAVRAGKHVYLQKPAALTISEGRTMADAVKASGRIVQIGSQQRGRSPGRNSTAPANWSATAASARSPCRGGAARRSLGPRGAADAGAEQPQLRRLARHHARDAVHRDRGASAGSSFEDRPGWLRIEQYGAGMITGWGSHHIDTAHWGMDMEHSGPVEIWGKAEFPKSGLWNVHGAFETHARYAMA
jgi:hypothetical protein